MATDGDDKTDVTINAFEMTDSWVFIRASTIEHDLEKLPFILSQALSDWLIKNPDNRVRATLPLVAGGYTVGIHIWFDNNSNKSTGFDEL